MVEIASMSFATRQWAAQWGLCWDGEASKDSEFVMLVKKVLGVFSLPLCRVSHSAAWATGGRMCLCKGHPGHHYKKVCAQGGCCQAAAMRNVF